MIIKAEELSKYKLYIRCNFNLQVNLRPDFFNNSKNKMKNRARKTFGFYEFSIANLKELFLPTFEPYGGKVNHPTGNTRTLHCRLRAKTCFFFNSLALSNKLFTALFWQLSKSDLRKCDDCLEVKWTTPHLLPHKVDHPRVKV